MITENSDALPSVDCYWNPGAETVREKLKQRTLHQISEASGTLRHVFGRLAKSTVGILTYHRITDSINGVPFPAINVTPTRFRSHLEGLQRAGFRFESLSKVLAVQEASRPLPERTVVITFDDIYDNVFQNAWPVLREMKIPATCFISTAFVDTTQPFLFDPWAREHRGRIPTDTWKPITSQHLTEMMDTGLVELGAHTHTHQDFRDSPEAFATDLATGIQELKTKFGVSGLPFAFPYGSPRMGFCNSELMKAVKVAGLRCGLSTESRTNSMTSSPFGWGRFHVFEHDTPQSLASKLDGYYEWLPRLKNRFTSGHNSSQTQLFTESSV